MSGLKQQFQMFALVGKLEKVVEHWLSTCVVSPGAPAAAKVKLEKILRLIEAYKPIEFKDIE